MKKKTLIFLIIIFLFISLFSFCFYKKEYKIEVDFESDAYSYLPESAKEFILEEANKGVRVLTEKNKKSGELYLNPIYVDYLTMSPAEQSNLQVVPEVYTWDNNVITKTNAFPSKYSLVEENLSTKVKNQSILGICWAFATYSSIETNILVSGLSKDAVHFAERQLDYVMANELIEIDNPYALENYELGTGANFTFATSYLNYGITPVEESVWGPFDTSFNKRSLKEVLNTSNVNYQVTDYIKYGSPLSTADEDYRAILKEHIQKYGSLYVAALPPSKAESGNCYNERLNLILDDGTCYNPNVGYHALAIVGWDDNYAGGAWILKNSWGENNTPYTYLAYDSLYYDVSGVTQVKIKNWDNIYDYTKFSTAVTEPNQYTITYEKDANFDEYLERISFTHSSANGLYKIYLKNGLTYKLIETVETKYPGLSTIEVGDILLDKETFSIKIVAEKGTLDNEVNVFTSNTSNDIYLETYEFDHNTSLLEEQLIVRNLETGTKLSYYIYDIYGKNHAVSNTSYVVNGTVNVNENVDLKKEIYYLTLEENFYQVNLSDEIIELDLNNKKEGQLSFSSSDLLTINSISYISDNPSVAAVDRNGTILAKGIGKTNIRLIINDEIERICEVIVGPYEDVLSVNIIPDEAIIYLNLSNELKLNLEIYPEEANVENITWTSNKPQVATVENGIVKALSSGSVTIKAEVNGVSDTIEIVVKNPSSAVVLNINEKILKVNETFNLIPNYPENLYHPTVSWISTNENVATVSDGLVTAHSNGLAEIILNVNNDEYISRAFIYVVDPTVLIDLDIDASGGTYQDSKIYKYKENSLNTITLIKPLYKVNVELDYGNVLEKKTFEVTHDFIGWSNYGDGVLNNNTYKFGFENSKLVANWKYNSLVLPDLSNIESDKIFVGWYKDPNYKEFIGKNISYIPLSNQTLYAYWASYKKADINDDALIDITDLVILRQYLAEIVLQDKINVLAADINEDGNVDITDLIILRKYLAGLEEIN